MPFAAAVVLVTPLFTHVGHAQAVSANPMAAQEAYVQGARLLKRHELAGAVQAFERAAALNPARTDYRQALDLTRSDRAVELIQQAAQARMTGKPAQADGLLAQARAADPHNDTVLEHAAAQASTEAVRVVRTPAPEFSPVIHLEPAPELKSPDLRGDIRQVIEYTAGLYGIKTVFEESPEPQQLKFTIDSIAYAPAMQTLYDLGHVFATPIDAHTVLIAKDTQENRQRLEHLVEETIYIPAASNEQLAELLTIVKSVFDIKQAAISPSAGTLVMRAPEATIDAANYTLADLVDGGAEVLLELRLITVDKTHTRNTGVQTPTSAGVFSVAQVAQSIVSANQSIIQQAIASGAFVPTGNVAQDILLEAVFLVLSGVATDARLSNIVAVFGGGLTLFGVNLGSATTVNLGLNTADARALDDLTVRIGDRQTTTLRVGSKYPVTTSTFSVGSGAATSNATINGVSVQSLLNQYLGSSGTSTTTPIIAYEDLGITLKTTPTVLKSGLVSLHVDLKLEALTGQSANNIPLLTSRAFTSDIIVPEGSTAVMLSDMSGSEASSIAGIPGLADLPGFRATAADTLKEQDSSELVLLATPHLVRRRSTELRSRPYVVHPATEQDN